MTGTTNELSLDVRLHCPACHAEGFQFQAGAEQLWALIECAACGWKGTLGELDIVPVPPHPSEIN